MKKPETKFRENQVEPFLKTLNNSFDESIQQQAIRGTADKILCINGIFIWLELKKDRHEKLKGIQKLKLRQVRQAGGVGIVAYPENWSHVKTRLKRLSRKVRHDKCRVR